MPMTASAQRANPCSVASTLSGFTALELVNNVYLFDLGVAKLSVR